MNSRASALLIAALIRKGEPLSRESEKSIDQLNSASRRTLNPRNRAIKGRRRRRGRCRERIANDRQDFQAREQKRPEPLKDREIDRKSSEFEQVKSCRVGIFVFITRASNQPDTRLATAGASRCCKRTVSFKVSEDPSVWKEIRPH